MMKTILIVIALLIFTVSVLAGTFRDDFEDGDFKGWTHLPGEKWLVKDGVLVTINNADFTALDLRPNLGEEFWGDYTVIFDGKVKSHQGRYCIAGGLRQQQKDLTKGWVYYALATNRLEASIYIDPEQYFGMIRVQNFLLELDKWYHFKVDVKGKKFDFFLDDKLEISADWKDQPFSTNGFVTLWTRYPGEYWFDNVVITGPDIPNTGPSGVNSRFISVGSIGKLVETWGKIKYLE